MTVVSGRAAGAVAALGSACWVSTLVFDRVGTGAGTRVAFLSSWQELVGLTVFAFLVVLIGKALVERALAERGGEQAIPSDLLLPVAALAVLTLPYLPFLADAVPALDALAGPGRWWVWGIVLAQAAWATAALVVPALGSSAPPLGERARLLVVGAASLAILGTGAWRLESGPTYPGGDEPHYLIVTQSLLTDHDLAIENNHARGDYKAYYAGVLKPDYRVRGRDGQIYSIHPVGVSALIAPAFALGGYRGASLFLTILAALTVTLAWRWAARITGSVEAATVGWLAVSLSAPFVLHSFAIYPEVAAGLAFIVALGPALTSDGSGADALVRGLALGALPWLSTKYAPASVVAFLLLAWGQPRRRGLTLAIPYATALLLWFGFFWVLYGTPSPVAPYGATHQMALWHLASAVPGLFADQEYGAVANAPALALSVAGAWRLWRGGGEGRQVSMMTLLPLVALAATAGAFEHWWVGSAPPGRDLVAGLPLLAVPLAFLWHTSAPKPVQRAALEWLVLVGGAVTATLVFAQGGLLIANGRDGASNLLEYLDAGRHLVRAVPSFIAYRSDVGVPLAASAIWIAAAATAWHVVGRLTPAGRGRAQLYASIASVAALTTAAVAVPLVLNRWLPPPVPVESQFSTGLLDRYDAQARPLAILYAPFRVIPPDRALSDITFSATPDSLTAPQPARVLMNARLALPAGHYSATIFPGPGHVLSGELGLQVGRLGPPVESWPIAGAGPATVNFALDVDSNFVGLRASPGLEPSVERLEVKPVSIVNLGARTRRPTVVAAAQYGGVRLYFHDDRVYLEPKGFWTKGQTTIALTVVPVDPAAEGPSVTLRLHGGRRAPVPVTLTTPAWSTHVEIAAGATMDVAVPSRPDLSMLPLSIAVGSGFTPADEAGVSDDRRWLGCWVEIVGK